MGSETDEMFADFFSSYSDELKSKMTRLDKIVGEKHWPSVGDFKESILRQMIAQRIPRRFEASSGFILSTKGGDKVLSRQLDLLIWDSHSNPPIFRDGEFVIIPPEACRGVVEVKSTLNNKTLEEALVNIDSVVNFIDHANADTCIYKAIFAFTSDESVSFPDSIFDKLSYYYESANLAMNKRVEWMRHLIKNPSLPWVNYIGALDTGCISLVPCKIGDDHHASYHSHPILDVTNNDTYGVLERQLLSNLITGNDSFLMGMFNPGLHDLYSRFDLKYFKNRWITIPHKDADSITNIGNIGEPFVTDSKRHLYTVPQ